ncbi:uncharacterized protein LOC143239772 isoform X2 [Tachypleus tridentatus]
MYHTTVVFLGNLFMMVLAAMSVISSVILLIGVYAERRIFLLPWIVVISITTLLHLILALYFITESSMNIFLGILFATDLAICAINVYCLLCVVSQYQEYVQRHAVARQHCNFQSIPVVRFDREGSSPQPKHTVPRLNVHGKLSPGYLGVPPPCASCSTPTRSHMSTELLSSYVEEQTVNDVSRPDNKDLCSRIQENNLQEEVTAPIKVFVTEQLEPSVGNKMQNI